MEAQHWDWVRVGICSQLPWPSLTLYTYSSYTTLLGMAWSGAEVVHGSESLEQNDHCADMCVENEAITDNSSLKVEDKNHNALIACLILTPLWGL